MITATASTPLVAAGLDGSAPPLDTQGASTRLEGGCVVFLNDHWDIDIHASGAICITALATGQAFMAWAGTQPPDAPPFEFEGYTTLLLADGTKVTLHTAPWDPASKLTRPDSVLIVSGDYGVQVLGLGSGKPGALSYVDTPDYGWLMDACVPDGAVLMPNPDGPGLVGDNPQGLWHALDVPDLGGGATGGFGPLAGPAGHVLLETGSVAGMLFMSSFSRVPMVQAFEFDRSSCASSDPHRLPDQEDALQRLLLQRVDGRVRAWVSGHPGVHPSSGAPGCHRAVGAG